MRGKTSKLLRKASRKAGSNLRADKRAWMATPRNERGALRQEIEGYIDT